MKTLLDLPVLPEDRDTAVATGIIHETYVDELDRIESLDAFKQFINRWQNIFLLLEPVSEKAQAIVSASFDMEAVFNLLLLKNENTLDFDDINVQIMAEIVLPPALLRAFMLARKFQVGTDVAMVRLYLDPYPELNDKLR